MLAQLAPSVSGDAQQQGIDVQGIGYGGYHWCHHNHLAILLITSLKKPQRRPTMKINKKLSVAKPAMYCPRLSNELPLPAIWPAGNAAAEK